VQSAPPSETRPGGAAFAEGESRRGSLGSRGQHERVPAGTGDRRPDVRAASDQ